MTEESPTLQEVFDYHIELADERAEQFEGDLPEQGLSAILDVAQGFDAILRRNEMLQADERIEEGPTDTDVAEALAEQVVDMFAALSDLKREYDLDVEPVFERRRTKMNAMREAESVEELTELLEGEGIELETLNMGDVSAGDNVDMEGYESDRRDHGIH